MFTYLITSCSLSNQNKKNKEMYPECTEQREIHYVNFEEKEEKYLKNGIHNKYYIQPELRKRRRCVRSLIILFQQVQAIFAFAHTSLNLTF